MVLAVDFSWSLSVWVSSKVVGMGFGGWNGGGMVVGTMIMVVVASRCYGGFVWCDWIFSLHAMARFAWWISFLSLRSSLKTQNPCT